MEHKNIYADRPDNVALTKGQNRSYGSIRASRGTELRARMDALKFQVPSRPEVSRAQMRLYLHRRHRRRTDDKMRFRRHFTFSTMGCRGCEGRASAHRPEEVFFVRRHSCAFILEHPGRVRDRAKRAIVSVPPRLSRLVHEGMRRLMWCTGQCPQGPSPEPIPGSSGAKIQRNKAGARRGANRLA